MPRVDLSVQVRARLSGKLQQHSLMLQPYLDAQLMAVAHAQQGTARRQ